MTLRPLFNGLTALTFAGLTLAACSEPAREDVTGMDHAAMTEMDGDAPAPLPDDGVMPVVDVSNAWIRPHPGGRDVTAAYFTARLSDGAADRLTGARIDGAEHVELHGHSMDADGVMQMRPVGPQQLAAEGELVFAPGGLHLMVFGLAPVVEGDTVEGVLIFQRAGEVPVSFSARSTPPGR